MGKVKNQLIKELNIKKLGIDMMGYTFNDINELSYHHLIIAKRYCKELKLGNGIYMWNGAILNQSTSHSYLHLIENYDYEIFSLISSEMIDENIKRKIELENLKKIKDLLTYFETHYSQVLNKYGEPIIKDRYLLK